jgi:hypothetical protein
MSGRRRALVAAVAGLAIASSYVAGAVMSGRSSVFARRPLLDGYSPPPPYRWVKPPPALAASNQPPLSGKASITFANGKSQAGVFRTDDSQIVVVILGGAIPPKPGQSVTLRLDPLAPDDGFGPPPSGLEIAGNVYRVHAAYEPSGAAVTTLDVGMEVVQVYPAPAQQGLRHTLLVSTDKKTWQRLPTVDSLIQHQVSSEHVRTLGYFAVSEATGSGTAPPPGAGGSILLPIVVAVALIALMVVVFLEVRRRRARAAAEFREESLRSSGSRGSGSHRRKR